MVRTPANHESEVRENGYVFKLDGDKCPTQYMFGDDLAEFKRENERSPATDYKITVLSWDEEVDQ